MTPRAVRKSESNKAKGTHTSARWQRLQLGRVLADSFNRAARVADWWRRRKRAKSSFNFSRVRLQTQAGIRVCDGVREQSAGSIWSLQISAVRSITHLIVKPTGSWIIENKYNQSITSGKPAGLSHAQTAAFSSLETSVQTFSLDLFSFTSILVTQIYWNLFCGFLPISATIA